MHGFESRKSFYFNFLSYKLYNTILYNTIRTVQIVYKFVKYEFVHGVVFVRINTNKFIQLLVVFVQIRIKSYNFYTNCIVRIHTKCDFFLSLCKQAASAQRKLRGRSPSCERAAQATSAAQAARAKPEHTSCPDQAAPGCPNH